MVVTRNMKAFTLICAAFLSLAGCGDDSAQAPKGAVRPPDPPPVETNTKPKDQWTLQDKIDAINKSGMPEDKKKETIAQLTAAGK